MTPTSAKMAAHILAMPMAPSTRHRPLMPSANTMFSYTIRRHLREMRMALEIFRGSSSISTTSAASMAASEPMAPMAMPISARDSTGASLMPSPTKASLPSALLSRRSTCATLSAGSSSLCTSSTHSSPATWSATRRISPVSMTVFSTPACFRAAMASLAWGFTTSEMTMWPAY